MDATLSASELRSALVAERPPLVIDVRGRDVFQGANGTIRGALWRDPERVVEWASGLAAISLGLSRKYADDQEMLKHGLVMYDALYAWCKGAQDEVHTWNPGAYR
jgi:Chromate resistance exported protein